jgi:hypothetical protein
MARIMLPKAPHCKKRVDENSILRDGNAALPKVQRPSYMARA